jgi:isopropylmalate/homocitrate/citramalate synthase
MFGLATACAVAGALAGADVVEASVDGFTEGPAQGCLQHVVGCLEILYGVDTGVDLAQLTRLARLTERLFGHQRSPDFGLTGSGVFDFGNDGDEYAQEYKVDPLIHMALTPDVVGNRARRRIGLTSGPFTMWDKLDELGVEVEQAEVEAILAACKREMSMLHRGLEDDEIVKIASDALVELRATSP